MFASFSYLGKIPEEQIARSIIYGAVFYLG